MVLSVVLALSFAVLFAAFVDRKPIIATFFSSLLLAIMSYIGVDTWILVVQTCMIQYLIEGLPMFMHAEYGEV